MTTEWIFGVASAAWLGLLTSISPCPLATNIAAISFIGRRVGSPRAVVAAGLLYTVGRSLAYATLASVLVWSLLSAPVVSHLLQKHMNQLLGPLLVVIGMLLLELLQFRMAGLGMGEKVGQRVQGWGAAGALILGVVFALAFCPTSAALFFGSLIPLAVAHRSGVLLPSVFGVSTGLPVFVFAVLIAAGARAVGNAFNRITQFEWWARRATGITFVAVGVYFSLSYIFHVL